MLLSQSEENYIKAIYALVEVTGESISTNLLAEKIQTKASSVTDMLKKLSDKKLVNYAKYQGCTLSEKGHKVAVMIIRKHRLWETFLVEKLNFSWDQVHEIAEQLEHIQSTELTDKLDAFLGFPSVDPHGDPIPNAEGKYKSTVRKKLTDCLLNETVTVIGVEDGEPAFLQYLLKLGIQLGSQLQIVDKLDFDGSITVNFENKVIQFSENTSKKISIA